MRQKTIRGVIPKQDTTLSTECHILGSWWAFTSFLILSYTQWMSLWLTQMRQKTSGTSLLHSHFVLPTETTTSIPMSAASSDPVLKNPLNTEVFLLSPLCFFCSSFNSFCLILVEQDYSAESKRSQSPHRSAGLSLRVYTENKEGQQVLLLRDNTFLKSPTRSSVLAYCCLGREDKKHHLAGHTCEKEDSLLSSSVPHDSKTNRILLHFQHHFIICHVLVMWAFTLVPLHLLVLQCAVLM